MEGSCRLHPEREGEEWKKKKRRREEGGEFRAWAVGLWKKEIKKEGRKEGKSWVRWAGPKEEEIEKKGKKEGIERKRRKKKDKKE